MTIETRESRSSFADLLDSSRRQLEALYAEANITPSQLRVGDGGSQDSGDQPVRAAVDRSNDPRQWLNEHYGRDWRYDIRDRRVTDDEVFVLVRLEVFAIGVRKSQFGCAMLDDTSNNDNSGVEGSRNAREKEAYDKATEDALLRCIDLL